MDKPDRRKNKAALSRIVDWKKTFPDYVFLEPGFRFAYFFETPWTARSDVGAELDRLLLVNGRGGTTSVEYNADGSFDPHRASSSIWTDDGDMLFNVKRVAEYRKSDPVWPGLTVASGDDQAWLLYENPSEPFGILVTKASLAELRPNDEIIFDVVRLKEVIDSSSTDFFPWVTTRLAEAYGKMA
jgi:hypothetical protein